MRDATLVDANVLLDVVTEDATWLAWSMGALADAAEAGPLWINPIIYAEVSVRFSRIEDLESALPLADYRRAGLLHWCTRGRRRGCTRDPRRNPLSDHFPSVRLVTPDS